MRTFLLRWALLVVALILASVLTSTLGLDFRSDVTGIVSVIKLFLAVGVLTLLSATLGALLKLLTLPLNCMTFGLVSLVINAAMLNIVGTLNMGVSIGSFWSAFVGSLFYSAFGALLATFLPDEDKDD